ncbi:MAG TPA: GGDEF domain-containing protein [Gemmatimonadaceae bacterium]|nr:GGDEF domain-containing protein [Gemmatimonadaceae bacterium]
MWQARLRVAYATLTAAAAIALLAARIVPYLPGLVVASLALDLAIVLLLWAIIRRTGQAGLGMVYATLLADMIFIFGVVGAAVPPQYNDLTLLLAFAVLHLTVFCFGTAPATATLMGVSAGYAGLSWVSQQSPGFVTWRHAFLSLGIFVGVGSAFIVQYGSVKARLAKIIDLLERAQAGDLSSEYATAADVHPDSITMVGRAYNRVRAELASLVLTDPLSGCFNRRGFAQELARELARAVRSGQEIAMLAVDVDYFKTVNDTLGHLVGDDVIREVGAVLKSVARGVDIVARMGGDEFIVLLPETGMPGAYRLAMRIREEIGARHFPGVEGRVPITVSIGLVADRVVDENIAHDLHSRADEALYAAKDGGRNRVAVWTSNLRTIAVSRAKEQVLEAR